MVYSDEWFGALGTYGWNPVNNVQEAINTTNLKIGYLPASNNLDAIGIWVGLGPDGIGTGPGASGSTAVGSHFVQAGYNILIISSDQIIIKWFLESAGSTSPYYYTDYIPTGTPVLLKVSLSNLENGTVEAQYLIKYSNGTLYSFKEYGAWSFSGNNGNSYTAYSMIEAPTVPSEQAELPYLTGGLIEQFSFNYISSGNEYLGPGTPASGTTFFAGIYTLDISAGYNVATASLYQASGSTGNWQYVYQFTYPQISVTTEAL
ncbi:hypothetical protein [Metallosphaera hakonensis]|uniref:Uncharacterized protein n=1 Tax=Metallosphaera hakonensis JCM 8857 = DSM 7519 TaxID=1293036 RepID=A0A2U9ITS4_9CREN|nr:hypothetical protein [Metallosphaera hakonensis]AWR99373.1 hypothetical protein DFR87_06260 [Metallosphaera hakonensis JCM 8857 = DSM 7519]